MMEGAVRLKSHREVQAIYKSCQVAAKLAGELKSRIKPGVSTAQLNDFAESFIAKQGCLPAFKGYQGFPAALCTSINEEIVHGIPSPKRTLKDGDILSVDFGVIRDGYYSDTAYTQFVGEGDVSEQLTKLLAATSEALDDGIAAVRAGAKLNRISEAISRRAHRDGFKVIRDLSGHGVGHYLHEPPTIYNYPVPAGESVQLKNGMVLAIEPMVAIGTDEIILGGDGWTYSTADGSLVAHFEHTVAVWDGEGVVLTQTGNGKAESIFGPA
jgi:methionyl aminopeptidase